MNILTNMRFSKFHIEYLLYNIKVPYTSCLCKICRNTSLLAKLLTIPHDLVKKLFTTLLKLNVFLENVHIVINDMILLYSSGAESSSETCSGCSGDNII